MREKEARKKVMKKVRKEILKLYGICFGLGTLMAAIVYFIFPFGSVPESVVKPVIESVAKPWSLFLLLVSFCSFMIMIVIMGGVKDAPVTSAKKIKEEIRKLSLEPENNSS